MSDVSDITVTPKASAVSSPTQGFSETNTLPIAGLLGLDTHNLADTDSEALQRIYQYVRGDAKEMTDLELLHGVRQLEQKLGMTNLGERRLDKIYRYVKLQSQIDSLSTARDRELR